MAAKIVDLADALTSAVLTAWNASISPATVTAPNEVSREYVAEINFDEFTGRRVFILTGNDYENGPASRGEDEWVYRIGAIVTERYTDAGKPTKAWLDARVEFVQNIVSETLDYVNNYLEISGRRIITQSNTVDVFDPDKLIEHKCFYSEVVFEFREIIV